MGTFLNQTYTKTADFYQPHLIRSRQPYRAPYSSERINLERGLFAYDIARLYARTDALQTLIDDNFEFLDSYSDDTFVTSVTFPDASSDSVSFYGIEYILDRMEAFEIRLRALEEK